MTVTLLLPVAKTPLVSGVIGMLILPLVLIDRDVSLPYLIMPYKPLPYGWARQIIGDDMTTNIQPIKVVEKILKKFMYFVMLMLL